MAEKTPAEKLLLKPGMRAALLHVPRELEGKLGVPDETPRADSPAEADFILDFAATQAEAEERLRELQPHVTAKTVAWLGYPKGSKAKGLDLSRDTIFAAAREAGLSVVANFGIDEKWSALRLRPL